MITITAELLHGVVRASRSETAAGSQTHSYAEWPPSPARLFAALVAGGGSGQHNRIHTDDSELLALEQAPPPLIIASAEDDVRFSTIEERYVVIDKSAKGAVQNYPARVAQVARPGDRTAPLCPFITYAWPEIELTPDELTNLRRRAARVGYLGAADSPVRLLVNQPTDEDRRVVWSPDDGGTAPVAVPYPGYLGELDRAFSRFRAGIPPRASSLRRVRVNYRPGRAPESDGPAPSVIWCQFDRGVNYRRVLAVAEALRGATMRSYDRLGFGPPPPVLDGHGLPKGSQHARFLPLPDVGHAYARGRILGAAIVLPADTPEEEVERVRVAVGMISHLRLRGGESRRIELRDLGAARPWATNPRRWLRRSVRFASAFPVVHERFGRVSESNVLDSVAPWFVNAGLPEPVSVRLSRVPFFEGLPRLEAREVWRPGSTDRYPFSHIVAEFDQPLQGPFAVGRGRSFGLGLMVPVDAQESAGAPEEAEIGGVSDE